MSNVDVVVAAFMGFGQTLRVETGLEPLLLDCVATQGKNVLVLQKQFNDNPQWLALYLQRVFVKYPNATRLIVGYSYGGTTAMNCSWYLHTLQVSGLVGVFSDAVWRPSLRLLWPLSLGGRGELVVPGAFDELHTYRQKQDAIRGAEISLADPVATKWLTDVTVQGVPHTQMDSLPAFHEKVKEVVQR